MPENERVKVQSAFDTNGALYEYTPTPRKGVRLGSQITVTDTDFTKDAMVQPGIMAVHYIPTCGVSTNPMSALNTGNLHLYSEIQKALKQRNLSYDKSDVGIHVLAQDSIRILYNDIARAYKATTEFSMYNAYIGEPLVRAMGYNYTDFLNNRPEIQSTLTVWASLINRFPIPKVFSLMKLHQQMSEYMYFDTVSDKAQMYIMVPDRVYSYAVVDQAEGLRYVDVHGGNYEGKQVTWATVKATMESLLAAIINSTDFSTINGAILSTFSESDLWTLTPPNFDEGLKYGHDPAFLNALTNAYMLNINAETAARFLPKDDGSGNLVCTPYIDNLAMYQVVPTAVNFLIDDPTSKEITNFMRWRPAVRYTPAGTDGYKAEILAYSTEWLTGYILVTPSTNIKSFIGAMNNNDQSITKVPGGMLGTSLRYDNSTGTADASQLLARLWAHGAFKFAPMHMVEITSLGGGENTQTERLLYAQWQYCGSVKDTTPYHEAWMWQAFSRDSGPAGAVASGDKPSGGEA